MIGSGSGSSTHQRRPWNVNVDVTLEMHFAEPRVCLNLIGTAAQLDAADKVIKASSRFVGTLACCRDGETVEPYRRRIRVEMSAIPCHQSMLSKFLSFYWLET